MIILNVFDQEDFEITVYGNRYSTGNVPLYYPQEWAVKSGADWVFNLAFFNFDTYDNRKKGVAGRTLQYVSNPKIGDIGYDAQAEPTPTIILQSGSKFRGWKPAVLSGIVQTPKLDKAQRRARNMNGLTADGRYIHAQSDRQTEVFVASEVNRLVKAMYGTTIRYLFVEDAGGSTQEYSAISRLNFQPEGARKVATVICIKRKSIYTFTRTLHKGMSGEDVKVLQSALGGIEVDGLFGAGTDKRLKQAQRALGLVADGYAGKLTYKAMGYQVKY